MNVLVSEFHRVKNSPRFWVLSLILVILVNEVFKRILGVSNGVAFFMYSMIGSTIYFYTRNKNGSKSSVKSEAAKVVNAVVEEAKAIIAPVLNHKPDVMLEIPNGAVSEKTKMVYMNKEHRFLFYLYRINGVEYVKPIKVQYVPIKGGKVKRIQTVLPIFKGSIHGAINHIIESKPVEPVAKVDKEVVTEKPQQPSPVAKPIDTQPAKVAPELGKEPVDVTTGTLTFFGLKESNFKGKTSENFTCTIRMPEGTLENLRGVELEDAIKHSHAKVGDMVAISKTRKRMESKNRDGSTKEYYKNLFSVIVLN
jgi:hypothetical protein